MSSSTRTLLNAPRLALRLARQPSPFRLLTTEASPVASTSSLPEAVPKLLPYYIPRTASNGLPVYGEIKSGGQRFLTIVRKVDGNVEVRFSPPLPLGRAELMRGVQALKRDLQEHLPHVDAYVKVQARQVVLKGDWVKESKEWLAARGF